MIYILHVIIRPCAYIPHLGCNMTNDAGVLFFPLFILQLSELRKSIQKMAEIMQRRVIRKGVYLLSCEIRRACTIRIGRLGRFKFEKGYYVYVGSAMGGLDQRIARHRRKGKKLHWHVDYLLEKAEIVEVQSFETDQKTEECRLAAKLAETADHVPVPGFGSSDCGCTSHLFYFRARKYF